jgi:signal transduction histidine kinase
MQSHQVSIHGMESQSYKWERMLFGLEPQPPELDEKVLNTIKIFSHDIRGSLISMVAILKLLCRGYCGKMDEGVEDRLNQLLSRMISLIGTTEEYLSLAFPLHDDSERELEALDVTRDIINPLVEELGPEMKDRQMRIENRVDATSCRKISIREGWMWLKVVFRNLLKNAINYGAKGGEIVLDFEKRESDCRMNVFSTGEPIPVEFRDKLFSKFARFGGGSYGATPGMGLGLYLVRQILREHGCDISYEAKENGSNFILTLPSVCRDRGDKE